MFGFGFDAIAGVLLFKDAPFVDQNTVEVNLFSGLSNQYQCMEKWYTN